jgi:hypothetical protein
MNTNSKHGLVWGGLLILFGVISLLESFTNFGPWVWVAVLAAAGLGIYAFYAQERTEKWMLIPSYVLLVIAGLVALITLNILRDEAIATYVLWAIGMPFLVAFLLDRAQWYFLIPAYVLFAVGLMVGLIGLRILDDLLIPAYIMFAIAIPFFVTYSRDTTQWWPLIPGGIMAIIGLSFLIAEASVQYVVPVALIIAGIWVLARQFTNRE